MSKATDGQARSLIASFAVDTPWDVIEGSTAQAFIELPPRERGARFAEFLRSHPWKSSESEVAIIHGRFNPKTFIGEDYSVYGHGTDVRSQRLTRLDPSKIRLVTMLSDGESHPTGEERIKRLEDKRYIRLDADIFLTFWERQHLIPESWKEKVDGKTRRVYFEGTILSRGGHREGYRFCVLCLFWDNDCWRWATHMVREGYGPDRPSAVLLA